MEQTRASHLSSASWTKVGNAEMGGKDMPSIQNRDKSTRAERPGLVSNPVLQRSWRQSL